MALPESEEMVYVLTCGAVDDEDAAGGIIEALDVPSSCDIAPRASERADGGLSNAGPAALGASGALDGVDRDLNANRCLSRSFPRSSANLVSSSFTCCHPSAPYPTTHSECASSATLC
jgi:hypothetical protein